MSLSDDKPIAFPFEYLVGKDAEKNAGGGKAPSFRISDILLKKEYENTSPSQVSPSGTFGGRESDDEQSKYKKARRARTVFTEEQLHALETAFQRHKYLSVQERQQLAGRMALSDIQVKTWYQNRSALARPEEIYLNLPLRGGNLDKMEEGDLRGELLAPAAPAAAPPPGTGPTATTLSSPSPDDSQ